jgi:hypothetical protein
MSPTQGWGSGRSLQKGWHDLAVTRIHPVFLICLVIGAVFFLVWLAVTLFPGPMHY